ncbi:MAG: DUF3108 domain-containing protein [Gemmatimonadaceae bacterium]
MSFRATRGTWSRRVVAIVAVAGPALLLAAPAHAQDTARSAAPVATDTTTPPLPPVDGFRLHEGTLRYRATLHLPDGTTRPAGIRTVQLTPTLYAGGVAWSVSERVDSVAATTNDSLVVARTDLLPLHWEGTRGPARIAAELARDTVYAGATWPTGRRSIVSALGGPVLTTTGHLELVASLLPLQPDWRATARLLLVDLGGARIVPVTLMVEGLETIQTPAGRFECWLLTMYGDRIEDRLWVRRDQPMVVRHTTLVPARGAQLELTLLP